MTDHQLAELNNSPPMKIGALLGYAGGKRTMAPRIVEALGPHTAYWEPFCGSMAVLLAKPKCSMETVNDLNGDLINLAYVITDKRLGPELYRKLRRTTLAEDFVAGSRLRHAGRPAWDGTADPARAYDYFVLSWMGRGGVAGTDSYSFGFCVRYTKSGGHGAKRFREAVDSIPAWRRRLRNVTILRRDAFELLDRIEDRKGTVIYADPPYITKGFKYAHDFADADHDRLAAALNRFQKTRVVLSYYQHDRLAELYPGWQVIDATTTKSLTNQGQRGRKGAVSAPERLLINAREGEALWGGEVAA